MASPSPINAPPAVPSRLIPGQQGSLASLPRKKAASVMEDGRLLGWIEPDVLPKASPKHFLTRLVETILPLPLLHGQQWRFGQQPIADFLLLVLSFLVANQLIPLLSAVVYRDPSALLRVPLLTASSWGLLFAYGMQFILLGHCESLYQSETIHTPNQERRILAKVVVWSSVLVGAAGFLNLHTISLFTLATSGILGFLFMLASRHLSAGSPGRGSYGPDVRNVLIIGAGKSGRKLATYLRQDAVCSRVVIGFLDQTEPIGGDIRGRLENLASIVRTDFVDEIILAAPQTREVARWVIQEARRNHIDVKIVPDLFGFEPDPQEFEKLGNILVLTVSEERVPAFALFLKHAIDVVLAVTILVIASPVLALVAIAIKAQSPGPVFYLAQRTGLKGICFLCYKFRTMTEGADKMKDGLRTRNERLGPFFKIVNDPRITRLGRFLRRYSLDELPQLWNVVRGEMSLVGPRPHPVDDVARYDIADLQRLDVLPGLTGLWQVTARGDPSFELNLALDLEYINSWTLGGDFHILYKTISVVFGGNGS